MEHKGHTIFTAARPFAVWHSPQLEYLVANSLHLFAGATGREQNDTMRVQVHHVSRMVHVFGSQLCTACKRLDETFRTVGRKGGITTTYYRSGD